jgi:hypothetical protein
MAILGTSIIKTVQIPSAVDVIEIGLSLDERSVRWGVQAVEREVSVRQGIHGFLVVIDALHFD